MGLSGQVSVTERLPGLFVPFILQHGGAEVASCPNLLTFFCLQCSHSAHQQQAASWETVDLIVQKVLLDAMVLSGRLDCRGVASSSCPRL